MALSMQLKLWLCLPGAALAATRSQGTWVNALHLLDDVHTWGNASAEPCPPRHVQLLDGRCELSWEIPDHECRVMHDHPRNNCNGRFYADPRGNFTKWDKSRGVSPEDGSCYKPENEFHYSYYDEVDRDWWSSHFLPCESEPGVAVKPPDGVRTLARIDEEDMQRLRDLMEELPHDAWQLPNAGFGQTKKVLNYTQAVFHFVEHRGAEFAPYLIFLHAPKVHAWIEPMLLKIARRYSYGGEQLPAAPGFLRKSVPRLFLASLEADMKQSSHIDVGGSSLRPHKIHVPLIEPIEATLGIKHPELGVQKFHMPVGYAYEVNNLQRHFAENLSDERRVHLIFEYMPVDIGSTETQEIGPIDKEALHEQKKERRKARRHAESSVADENEL